MGGLSNFDLHEQIRAEVKGIHEFTNPEVEEHVQRIPPAAEEAMRQEYIEMTSASGASPVIIPDYSGDFDWIPEHFERFYSRNPWTAESMSQQIQSAKEHIHSGRIVDIENVRDITDNHFAGETQLAFRDNFLNPYTTGRVLENQHGVFAELQTVLGAYEAMLRQSRADAVAIAEKTIDALDGLGGGFMGTGGGSEAQFGLAVVGAVVGVLGAAVTGGSSLAITFAAIGGGVAVTSAGLSEADEAVEDDIEGSSVDEVLESMRSALNKLWDYMEKVEQVLALALQESIDMLLGKIDSGDSHEKREILPHEVNSNAGGSGDDTPTLGGEGDVSLDPEDNEFYPRG